MWILPLGLENKIRRWPLASIALVGATIATSVMSFDRSQLNVRSRIQNEQKSGYAIALRELYLAECRLREWGFCDDAAKDWAAGKPAWIMRARWARRPPGEGPTKSKRAVASVAKDGPLKNFLDLLSEDPFDKSANFQVLTSSQPDSISLVSRWKQARETYFELRRADLKKIGQLTPENVSWKSVISAQFSHGSWMHLIGNMVVLAITLPFVEMRLGALSAGLLYLTAGLAGLWGYTWFMPSDQALVGASAGVSAILGAFMVLFIRQRLRLWISFFGAWNKTHTVPVLWSVPALFLASDLAGTLEKGGSVAHGAHILGFLAGILTAWALDRWAPLPAGMCFPDEIDDLQALKKATSPHEQSRILDRWGKTHPSGSLFRRHLLDWLKLEVRRPAGAELKSWPPRLLSLAEHGHLDFAEIPVPDFFRIPWESADRQALVGIADRRLRQGDWARALRLYESAGDASTAALITRRLNDDQRRQLTDWKEKPSEGGAA